MSANNETAKVMHPLLKLCIGRAVIVLRQKGSNSVISGTCKRFTNGFLKLEDATIRLPQGESLSAPWVLVDCQTIAHVHPAEAKPENS